jgi:hypothetical protein
VVEDLYPWAKEQVRFLKIPEWRAHHSEELKQDFPDTLFLFVDGTVLEIYSPSDAKARRAHYNSKHCFCAWSFFVVVSPMGEIVYVSKLSAGSEHDASQWDASDCVAKLQHKYLFLHPDRAKTKLALAGDKAYPRIDLPRYWHLYVTMTADEPEDDV